MLPGHIFRREVKAAARRRDLFVRRASLAVLLGGVALEATYAYTEGTAAEAPRDRRAKVVKTTDAEVGKGSRI